MNRKLIALLLVLTLVLSMTACRTSDEEESATSGEVVQENDNGNTDNNSNNQNNNQDNNQNDSNDNTPSDSTHDDNGSNNSSTDGLIEVTLDYGYDGKKKTKSVAGKLNIDDPERNGYKFIGWQKNGKSWKSGETVALGDTIVALWQAITYTIEYDAADGTLPKNNPVTYTAEDNIPLFPATHKYRRFIGWSYKNQSGGQVTINEISQGTYGNLKLTASFDSSSIYFGAYEQDGDTSNGKEPIEWIVFKEENGLSYLISDKILDAKPYNTEYAGTNWANCSLQKWLNNEFYNQAFNKNQKELIIKCTNVTVPNSKTGKGEKVTTEEYVTLLALNDAYKLSYAKRKVTVTPYAKNQGCVASNKGTGDWWLRTTGANSSYAAIIQQNSGIRTNGYKVSMTTIGIRPVICMDLSKLS